MSGVGIPDGPLQQSNNSQYSSSNNNADILRRRQQPETTPPATTTANPATSQLESALSSMTLLHDARIYFVQQTRRRTFTESAAEAAKQRAEVLLLVRGHPNKALLSGGRSDKAERANRSIAFIWCNFYVDTDGVDGGWWMVFRWISFVGKEQATYGWICLRQAAGMSGRQGGKGDQESDTCRHTKYVHPCFSPDSGGQVY